MAFKFKVYQTELEKVQEFNGFEDFISTFPIYRGRAKSREEEADTIVGEFKVNNVFAASKSERMLHFSRGKVRQLIKNINFFREHLECIRCQKMNRFVPYQILFSRISHRANL